MVKILGYLLSEKSINKFFLKDQLFTGQMIVAL